jgi:N-acetylglutamate synthase-like GNAT family acetyltransferase
MNEAFAFMRRSDIAGTREEPSKVGTAVFDERLPDRWDSNYLYVEQETTAAELAAEIERHGRKQAVVPDERLGAALAPAMAERGFRVDRHVVMVLRREPDRTPDLLRVVEVGHEQLRALRTQEILAQPWGSEETARTLLSAKPLIAERVTARFFAALEEGEVVSGTDLYLEGRWAQVEDVATSPGHRNRGHASAVVLRAIAEARASGADFVFLVADDEDWPKEWYGKLGFDVVGCYYKFIRP